MPFYAEHAWRVIKLLADVFTDALEGAAAWALGVFRLVMNLCARKLGRQRSALGMLAGY